MSTENPYRTPTLAEPVCKQCAERAEYQPNWFERLLAYLVIGAVMCILAYGCVALMRDLTGYEVGLTAKGQQLVQDFCELWEWLR